MAFVDDLRVLINARHSVIWVNTHEEERVLRILWGIAQRPTGKAPTTEAPAKDLQVWSLSKGLLECTGDHPDDFKAVDRDLVDPTVVIAQIVKNKNKGRTIYVLRDLHKFLGENNPTYRFLRDAATALKQSYSTIIITSPTSAIPLELQKCVTLIDMPLPTAEELGVRLDLLGFDVNGSREAIIKAALGLTEDECEAAVLESVARLGGTIDPKIVVKSKQQILRKNSVEFFEPTEDLSAVGGHALLKQWIHQRAAAFTEKAAQFGVEPPKGLFLTGPPGTGKSLTAKATAATLGMPLLQMDPAAIFGKYVGESEGNLQRILKTAEAVAPCVLWVDEVEKTLAGAQGTGNEDSGVTVRVFGALLKWMEEHRAPVMVIATANNPLGIPPALLRRFDATFFVDLPDLEERANIFAIHIAKKGRSPKKFDLEALAEKTEDYSGSEIRTVVNEALSAALADGSKDVNQSHLMGAIQEMGKPVAESRREEVTAMRGWAEANAKPASLRVAAGPKSRRAFVEA